MLGVAPPQDDLMTRVLNREREKSGKSEPVSTPDDSPIDNITSNITAHIPSNEEAQPVMKKRSNAEVQKTARINRQEATRADGLQRAKESASGTAMPITLRLSSDLNDFVDDLVHEHRKQDVRKQDVIALGMQLLENGADLPSRRPRSLPVWRLGISRLPGSSGDWSAPSAEKRSRDITFSLDKKTLTGLQ